MSSPRPGRRPGAQARVILGDGRVVRAEVVASKDAVDARCRSDWALLRLVGPPPGLASLELGTAAPGALALLLGYPDRIGVMPFGEARMDDVRSPKALAPVACAVRVERAVDRDVRPVAGATPRSGISGGALVDARRRVVGIEHRASFHQEADASWTTYECDDAAEIRALLESDAAGPGAARGPP